MPKKEEPAYFNLGLSSDQDQSKRNYFSLFPEEIIASVLDSFIINKPAVGGVGGDGFWVYQEDNELIVALFDCMGHGHLASMMTRIYTQTFDKVVKEEGIKDPGTILRYLHHKLGIKFRDKSEMQLGPGADVGVVRINMEIRKIEFSGAKTSLIQSTKGVVDEIATSRMQVGDLFDYPHNYETTLVDIKDNKQASFYLMSDGYKDLMGGPSGKKIGSKSVKNTFQEIFGLPMVKQKEVVEETINSWKGSREQNDDILIIGFNL